MVPGIVGGFLMLRPRRRAAAKAFLSVERSCNSLNSFCAAKVDASSTDQAAAGDRRRAKEAIQEEKQAEGPSSAISRARSSAISRGLMKPLGAFNYCLLSIITYEK